MILPIRAFLAGKLPSLIVDRLPRDDDTQTWGPGYLVWANAVRLAGQLRLVEAIPALKLALWREPATMIGAYDDKYKGASTITINARLGNDIIGRALADIGDPSIPVVMEMLSNGTFPEKRRVYWILVNIDSLAEQEAMRNHLPSESDPGLRGMIQKRLRLPE